MTTSVNCKPSDKSLVSYDEELREIWIEKVDSKISEVLKK